MDVTTRKLTRAQLAEFLPNHRAIVAFETTQDDTMNAGDALSSASFVTLSTDMNLGAERVLTGSANISITDDGAMLPVVLDLTDTPIVNGTYGSATQTVQYTVDSKGRLIGGNSYILNTSNITEGSKLFFTAFRALSAFVPSARISINTGTGAIDTIGFSGSGAYTNFTFVNGICTAAS